MAPSDPSLELEPEARACASDLTIDAHLASELSDDANARLLSHVQSCERCAERVRELEAFRAEAQKLLPPAFASKGGELAATPRRAARRTPRSRWAGVLAGAGALAAAATFALWMGPRPTEESDASRTKGGDRLAFHVSRGGSVFEGGPGEMVRPGDTLSFSITTQTPSFVAVLSRDGEGRASVYYPSGATAVSVPAGLNQLPEGVVLDDVIGRESLYGVFCSSPVELEPIRRTLELKGKLSNLPGCRVDVVPIEKQGR